MQLVAVWVIVAASLAYLLRVTWRTWFGEKCGGCGKCAAPVETKTEGRIPLPQL